MSGSVGFDLAELSDFVTRVAAVERQVEALAERLDAAVRRLHVEWSGSAATQHLAAHRQWAASEQRLRTALAVLRRVVATAHGNYSAAVEANSAMWR